MDKGGAPKGNNNAGKNKIWSDALRKEVGGAKNADKLKRIAQKVVDMAEEGNPFAITEIGNRLDGKPAQIVEGMGGDGEIVIKITTDDESVL